MEKKALLVFRAKGFNRYYMLKNYDYDTECKWMRRSSAY